MLCSDGKELDPNHLTAEKLTANSEFDQAHGTSEDMRTRIIKGMPFDR
jgi:hypothetical protein